VTAVDIDYATFDLAVDVQVLHPADNPTVTATPAQLIHTVGTTVITIEVRRTSAGLFVYGEVAVGGVVVDSGIQATSLETLTLRLVRNGQKVYGMYGVRDDTQEYSSEVTVFETTITTSLAGSVQLRALNGAQSFAARSRFANFTVEPHATINNRLLVNKRIVTSRQLRGEVPAATLAEIGDASVSVFGLSGSATDATIFDYTLPAPRTVGNEIVRAMRTYVDPTLRD